jgi:hypothetical protein
LPVAADPSADSAPRSPVAPMTEPPGTHDQWFVLLQEAFLAATRKDTVTLRALCDQLRRDRRGWVYEAVQTLMSDGPSVADASEQPPSSLEALLPFVTAAYVSGRADLVERACETFRVGNAQKAKRIAVANALAILAGRTTQILRPGALT